MLSDGDNERGMMITMMVDDGDDDDGDADDKEEYGLSLR